MQITHSTRDGCLVVALTGQITVATAPQIQRALLKDLAEGPLAIICDLGGVDALDPVCATVFATVANHPASRWPAASVLLCGARPAVAEVLGGLRVRHSLPLYDTLQEAVDAAVDRPGYLRDELRLAPTPTAPATARRFVRETLQSWRLGIPDGELSEQAQLLADELVTNAVVHARTDLRLRLELGGELLHIAVRDLDRRLPRVLPNDPDAESGRGLRLVKWIAAAWGAKHHPEGGKVVWCTLRIPRVGPSQAAGGGPTLPILESELTPPVRRPGMVPRPNPLGHLTVASGVPVVSLVSPPGYGKTTLGQRVAQDARRSMWLSVGQYDDDPARPLTHLAAALDRVEPVDPAVFAALAPGTSAVATMDDATPPGDPEYLAGLLVRLAFAAYYDGRLATLQRWFDWIDGHQLLERYPTVAALGAWLQAQLGRTAAAERWADAAERGAFRETGTLPDDTASIDGWLALLRAVMCRHGVEQLRTDAELACRLVPRGSLLRASAVLLLGISRQLVGDHDSADGLLAEAVEVAEDTKATDTAAIALAERALLAIDRGDWDKAELLADHGRSLLRQAHLDDHVTNVLLYAVAARLAAHRGQVAGAHADLARAQRLRPQLTVALPIYAVQARLELARTYLALTDVAGTRTVLREVDELLWRRPQLGVLVRQAGQLHARVATMRADVLGASTLTAAELRVLPLLATHLSFREIGDRLHVSSHTVKTHAISIYRKLGVSSRSQAIQHSQRLDLLPA
jgi:DNA-binding CsgD family transcriptional regulator/anti-anti-sigma regulatory factor/tetratricopeptide (TPR) repeat protein/anti-sigma regulatory factor (Ser/Thr protein kinase)